MLMMACLAALLGASAPPCPTLELRACVGTGYEVRLRDAEPRDCEPLRGATVRVHSADEGVSEADSTGRGGRARVRLRGDFDELLLDVTSPRNGGVVDLPLHEVVKFSSGSAAPCHGSADCASSGGVVNVEVRLRQWLGGPRELLVLGSVSNATTTHDFGPSAQSLNDVEVADLTFTTPGLSGSLTCHARVVDAGQSRLDLADAVSP